MKTNPVMPMALLVSTLTFAISAGMEVNAGGQRCLERHRQEVAAFHGTSGVTGLMRAALSGDVTAAVEAVRQGDAINARTSDTNASGAHVGGLTALMIAAGKGHEAMVNWLIERGAAVSVRSANGQTALGRAVFAGESGKNVAIVKALLAAGADPNVDRPKNLTLVEVANRSGNQKIAALLSAAVKPQAKQ